MKSIFAGIVLLLLIGYSQGVKASAQEQAGECPILVVTTDIGGDPDDQQSLTRLLLYSNEFDIRGLIASSSGTPGELSLDTVKDQLIREHILAYARVYGKLVQHFNGYSNPDSLLACVKKGNPRRGLEHIGEGNDTEGSEWIIGVVDRAGDRPVHVAVWGGQTDLVQALWKIKHTRDQDMYFQFLSRLRVYDINDQDNLYSYIREEFTGIFYILAEAPEGADKREGAYRGMYLGGEESFTSREWIDANVLMEHGPLGELYPPETWTAPNPHGALKEGDTPSWFYFLLNGLQDPEQPSWGGWGGRFKLAGDNFYRDDDDFADMIIHARSTVSRWRPSFQNDFQARMNWCVLPDDQANHCPVAVVLGDETNEILYVEASQGDTLSYSALNSYDMDGDNLSFSWWTYPEAGTNMQCPSLENYMSPEVSFILPYGEGGKDLHLICEVSDHGNPSLSSYRRIVIMIL
jgi:hypothetical protein